MQRAGARAFTVIELLVVVSIIALLVGILLPAIGKARDQARTTISQANLRNLSSAHASYAAEWNDRQLTYCDDNASHYGEEECEPYYFNHAWESSPVTLFYDSHVENIGVRQTMRADGRVRVQTDNEDWSLWSQDVVPWGINGYLSEDGYDRAQTSFHILTTDGILGRDILSN